jgi:cysteinyl-tRNA synthetase
MDGLALNWVDTDMESEMIDAIENLVSERSAAMKEGNAMRAKEIESELARFGVLLTDTRYGTLWKIA